MTPWSIAILCETSGRMRRAFAARGHNVTSIDLLPADDGSNHHIVGDVRDHLDRDWDMIVVAHPPCTRLCNSGVRWLSAPPRGRTLEDMWDELKVGADLFAACWRAKAPRLAIENPIMHKHAKALMPGDLPRPQIVQPWWFGEPYFKATGFYLRGLPQLVAANRLTPPRKAEDPARHAAWSKIHRASPGPDRWKLRSATFPGVAAACAEQWSPMIEEMAECSC